MNAYTIEASTNTLGTRLFGPKRARPAAQNRLSYSPVRKWYWYFAAALALSLYMVPLILIAADLTLEDGVVVKFGPGAQLVVRDKLVAGKGVVMTSQKDDSALGLLGPAPQAPAPGDWLGLRLEKSAASFGALTLERPHPALRRRHYR